MKKQTTARGEQATGAIKSPALSAKSRIVLVLSAVLVIAGATVFLFALPSLDEDTTYRTEAPAESFFSIRIETSGCVVNIEKSDGETYARFSGFGASPYIFGVSDGILYVSDTVKLSDFFDLKKAPVKTEGIGNYIAREISQDDSEKIIDLYLSENALSSPVIISSESSNVNINASAEYVTISACDSIVNANDFSFINFHADLSNSDIDISTPYGKDEFSRDISVYNSSFTINGQSGVNSDFYKADNGSPEIALTVYGGNVIFSYDEQ